MDRQPGNQRLRRRLRLAVLSALSIVALAGSARAFVPSPEHDALEIPLPFQSGKLVSGADASLARPAVAASIGERLGGQWRVHSWNRQTGSPHYVIGSGAEVAPGIRDQADAETAALHVLQQNEDLLGLHVDQLRLDTVREGAGKAAVHYQQTYEGLDVIGGRAHATFLDTGRLFVMGSDFYEIDGLNVTPALSREQAERIAIDALPQAERSISTQADEKTGLYVLPYPVSAESFEPRLVWRATVVTDGRTGVFHTFLDAQDGTILWRYNDVHFVNYSGTIRADVNRNTWCNGESDRPVGYAYVFVVGAGDTQTSGAGTWTLANGDNTPRTCNTRFYGPYADVDRETGGEDAMLSETATPGTPLNYRWTDSNSRQDERDVFDSISAIHDFFEIVDPGFAYSNARITANVGVPGSCNAFWNGSLNFYDQSGGCANTGEVQSVVHHEFGHGVQHHLIGMQGPEGLGEGNADILANFMTDESAIGRGFYLSNCDGGIRDSDNDLQYPENLVGEEHADGRIIAGVMWDVRLNLISSLGAGPGKFRAAHLWHFGRKLEMPSSQPDQVLSLFIADDDNGNLMDGTPNYGAICPAVLAHDTDRDFFDCADPGSVWVDFSYVGPEDGSMGRPYNSIFQAHTAAPTGYIMKILGGTSTEIGILSKPGTIRPMYSGLVRIGAP